MTKNGSYVVMLTALLAMPAGADVWDTQSDNDAGVSSDNQLLHATTQTHDLGVRPGPLADEDWYLMPQKPHASYEVLVDGVSADVVSPLGSLTIARVAADGTTVLQTAERAVLGSQYSFSRALRWANTTSETINEYIRVYGADCGTSCGADDVYTIRVHETTVNLARFNATGGQVTVLLTQNASERAVNATAFYWNGAGTLLYAGTLNLPSKATDVLNVATLPAVAGQSGSITVAHDGGYGGLVIKAVALESATGFSFDTPGVYVPD